MRLQAFSSLQAWAAAFAICAALLAAPTTAAPDAFLGRPSLEQLAERADPLLLQRLVIEVEAALGGSMHNGTKQHLGQIEEMLRPTFWALPKNEHGRLEHAAVRYALHRLFVQRYGWVIRGFQQTCISDTRNTSGEAWTSNASSAAQLLQGHVPGLVQELFEGRIGERGASLHDVAVLAALFEHLIHEDTHKRLRDVYQVSGVQQTDVLEAAAAEDVLTLYMMIFIQGYSSEILSFTEEGIGHLREHFQLIYPAWPKVQDLLQEVKHAVALHLEHFSFADVARVVSEAVHRFYGHVHRGECQHTKDMLLEMEDRGSGRVRLLDFYRGAIHDGKYQFTETIEYLRQTGILDESDAATPRVIIPNYVSGQANCVARSSYYAICCPDDCEAFFDHLEHILRRPDATPAEILAWVSDGEPDRIPSLLARRLESAAAHHGGRVQLHGRLFAQWMHFAFPQYCAYPHLSGTTYTKTIEEWELETGGNAGSSLEEILTWERHLAEQSEAVSGTGGNHSAVDAGDESGLWWADAASDMWTMEEELVVTTHTAAPTVDGAVGVPSLALARGAMFMSVFGVALAILGGRLGGSSGGRSKAQGLPAGAGDETRKQYV